MRANLILGACLLTLAACNKNGGTGTDAGGGTHDSGPPPAVDAGHDAGHSTTPDSGPGDPCAGGNTNAIATLGCNGPPAPGASAAPNTYGGLCTSDMTEAGSCTNPNGVCAADPGQMGICLMTCTPGPGGNYTSTGGCPTGSRCFDLGMGFAVCYPDCNSGADCVTGGCDGEGSCEPPAPTDGGVADGGVGGDGGPAPDGGVTVHDAGPAGG